MAKRMQSPAKPRPAKLKRPARPQLLADPAVYEITQRILSSMAKGGETDVRARVEVGTDLLEARNRMKHGQWLRWIEHHLPFSSSTAKRAIQLHKYADKKPELFERVAPMGIARAFLLLTLHDVTANKILTGKHTVGRTGAKKSAEEMSFAEMLQLAGKLAGKPVPDPEQALYSSYRRSGRNVVRVIEALVEHPEQFDHDDIEEIHQEVQDALDRLAAAFHIGEEP